MKRGRAILIGTQTKDGFWRVKLPQTPVGREYVVDMDSRRMCEYFNVSAQRFFECEVIDTWDDSQNDWAPMPTELLEIQG